MKYLQPKSVYNRIGWFLSVLLAVMLYIQILGIILGVTIDKQILENMDFIMILNIVSYYCIAFPIYAVCMNTLEGKPKEEKEKLGVGKFVVVFLIAFSFINVANLINVGFSALFKVITGVTLKGELDDILTEPNLMTVLTTVILAPFFEELTFRYFALNKLRKYGDKTAIFATAVLFGLFHMNFEQGIYAVAVGCVLGYVACRTGRIGYCIAIHMLVNFCGGILPLLVETSQNPLIETIYNTGYFSLILLGAVLFLVNCKRIKLEPAKEYVPNPLGSFLANPGMLIFVITCVLFMVYSFGMKVFTSVFPNF